MNRICQMIFRIAAAVQTNTTFPLLCFVLLFGLGFNAAAQTSTNRPTISNRWLIIVETSKGMKARSEAAKNLAARLAASGIAGQMRPGDTLGLWTFNEELYSGQFPLQDWTPERSQMIARRIFEFVGTQPYEKESRWAKVLPDLKEVVAASDFISVIVISDGTSKIQGTPFDDKINTSYAEWQEQQRKAAMPFITLLRAQNGRFTNYMVNTPPFQLELPPLPDELLHPKVVVETKPVEQAPPPKVLPPLILSGKKPEPVPPPAEIIPEVPSNQVAVVSNPPTATNSEMVSSNPLIETAKTSEPIIHSTNAETSSASKTVSAEAPNQTTSSRNWMLITAVVIALVFLVLLVFQVRRSRRTTHVSLITRSLDREQK